MARAGVSNRIGRESVMEYGESLAGVRPHDNITSISPFIIPDDPDSGLLPLVEDPIGLAQYGIGTYPARRTWFERNDSIFVAIEGNMFVGYSLLVIMMINKMSVWYPDFIRF